MKRLSVASCCALMTILIASSSAQVPKPRDFTPVTDEVLLKPDPGDWLQWGRTYDWQRFSPLTLVNRNNVHRLQLVWARGMRPGINQNSPIVHNGVMGGLDQSRGSGKARNAQDRRHAGRAPGGLWALDRQTGKFLWETILGDSISNGPITYMVNGRQYVAQVAGNPGGGGAIGANAIYVFALPVE